MSSEQQTWECPHCNNTYKITIERSVKAGVTVQSIQATEFVEMPEFKIEWRDCKNRFTGQTYQKMRIMAMEAKCPKCDWKGAFMPKQEKPVQKARPARDNATDCMQERFRNAPRREEDDGLL